MENKLLAEILGFVVLGGPLIAMVLILAGLVIVVWWFMRRKGGEPRHWRRAVIAAVAFLLIFTWDEILGRAYFYSLCASEGGIKVYKQVELPADYWDADGGPKFITSRGELDQLMLGNQYEWSFEGQTVTNPTAKFFNMRKSVDVIRVRQTNEVLGEYVVILYPGGWLVNSVSWRGGGVGCPPVKQISSREIIGSIFKPAITND